MKRIFAISAALFAALLLTACGGGGGSSKKSTNYTPTKPVSTEAQTSIKLSILPKGGDTALLADMEVKYAFGAKQGYATKNADGTYIIDFKAAPANIRANVTGNYADLKISCESKTGKFVPFNKTYKDVFSNADETKLDITLLPVPTTDGPTALTGAVSASKDASTLLTNKAVSQTVGSISEHGFEITFPAGTIIQDDGDPLAANSRVTATLFSLKAAQAKSSEILSYFPGEFAGNNLPASPNGTPFEPYAFIYVNMPDGLEDDWENTSAKPTIKIKIENKGTSIPLLHFDDDDWDYVGEALWNEEDQCYMYEGITDFSWYCLAEPIPLADLQGTIKVVVNFEPENQVLLIKKVKDFAEANKHRLDSDMFDDDELTIPDDLFDPVYFIVDTFANWNTIEWNGKEYVGIYGDSSTLNEEFINLICDDFIPEEDARKVKEEAAKLLQDLYKAAIAEPTIKIEPLHGVKITANIFKNDIPVWSYSTFTDNTGTAELHNIPNGFKWDDIEENNIEDITFEHPDYSVKMLAAVKTSDGLLINCIATPKK
ncbi:MAG: hypothetical protein GX221_01990 [Candidatus Riflebacteria bacterium]|nr:hypothetical protein [Candidatus Riflebacteria bacterium]